MLGLKIFVRVQTFRWVPPVQLLPPCNRSKRQRERFLCIRHIFIFLQLKPSAQVINCCLGKMCLLIIRSIYFWYCLYLFAKWKWEVEQWFSCFECFSFFFALFKKMQSLKQKCQTYVLGQFLRGTHSIEVPAGVPGLSQLLELGLTELELSHRCLVSQSISQLVAMKIMANIPKLPILPFLINLSENHTWICFKMGYIQRQLDRFSN